MSQIALSRSAHESFRPVFLGSHQYSIRFTIGDRLVDLLEGRDEIIDVLEFDGWLVLRQIQRLVAVAELDIGFAVAGIRPPPTAKLD